MIGGGCGGAAAAVQAARLGVKVVIADEIPWLGGMMSSAAVSCMDGNAGTLRTGMYRDVTDIIGGYYGSFASTNTGAWVSVLCYEPKAGNWAWQYLVSTTGNINTYFNSTCTKVLYSGNTVIGAEFLTSSGNSVRIYAHVTMDGTEYGDILALAGIPFRVGRDSRTDYGEYAAPTTRDNLVQDITFCAIFKNYGTPTTLIPAPPGYDSTRYDGSAKEFCTDTTIHLHTIHPYATMMSYGQLQNKKYMINWPIHGNDWDVNIMELTYDQKTNQLQLAKNETLGFLRYIQTVCGHPEIGLATDEYPTPDYLPYIPYSRESRRMEGTITYRLQDVIDRYTTASGEIYKTSIAVGNYSIDHHHKKFHQDLTNPYRTQGESYPASESITIPYGTMIPQTTEGFMAIDKNISVTHIVNGATRLQPVVVLTGQAAGAAAALSCLSSMQPRQVNIRQLQQVLLNYRAMLMPFTDIADTRWDFQEINRVSLSGVFKATDVTSSWTKSCYFYPAIVMSEISTLSAVRIAAGNSSLTSRFVSSTSTTALTRTKLAQLFWEIKGFGAPTSFAPYFTDVPVSHSAFTAVQYMKEKGWTKGWADSNTYSPASTVSREILAVVIDRALDPFHQLPIVIGVSTTTTVNTNFIKKLQVVWKRHYTTTSEGWTSNPPAWFVSNNDYCRDMAFNPATGHLLVSDFSSNVIHVLDSSNGADLGTLMNTGIVDGYRTLMSLDVDSSGVIYACNYDKTISKIYRWANEAAIPTVAMQTSVPVEAGRVMSVCGTGTQTIIALSCATSAGGFYLYRTSNGTQFNLSETVMPGAAMNGFGAYGLSLENATTIYMKGVNTSLVRYTKSGAAWGADAGFSKSDYPDSILSDVQYIPARRWLVSFAYNPYGPYDIGSSLTVANTGCLIHSLSASNALTLQAAAVLEATVADPNSEGGMGYDPVNRRLFMMMPNNGIACYSTLPIETATDVAQWELYDKL